MWKSLRNIGLFALLLAGALKLLVGYGAGKEVVRLGTHVAPYAQVRYDGVSAGLDGSVTLSGLSITTSSGPVHETYAADRVTVETPGLFWLLQKSLLGDDKFPSRIGVNIRGLKLPATGPSALLDSWISPISLVPFETMGCGMVTRFSVADYQRMGLNPGERSERLELRYDAEAQTVDAKASLIAPAFATIGIHLELLHFDANAPFSAATQKSFRVGQFAVDYTDQDYLQRRNRFCGQIASVDPAKFVEDHLAAVRTFLHEHNIDADPSLMRLYRDLVQTGGHASVLSLPSAALHPDQISASEPEELMRQLNVTVRHNDAPPIMFRLAFTPVPTVHGDAVTANDAALTAASVARPPVANTAPVATTVTPPPSVPTPAKPAEIAKPPVDIVASAPSRKPDPESRGPALVPATVATSTKPAIAAAPAAGTPSRPVVSNTSTTQTAASASAREERAPPSTPPPPPGSTLALVWKATIERLPETPPPALDYDTIDYAGLGTHVGQRVRLLTANGKRIEGEVVNADSTGVLLLVGGSDGSAQLQIARTSIVEVQLLHARNRSNSG